MTKFSHLKSFDVSSDKFVEYKVQEIEVNGEVPVLRVKPATEANKPYFRELVKRANELSRQVRGRDIKAETLEESRDVDRVLYAEHIIVGWTNVIGEDGKDVPFSQKDCTDFLENIPGWVFDKCRTFCGEPENFAASKVDVGAVAKN